MTLPATARPGQAAVRLLPHALQEQLQNPLALHHPIGFRSLLPRLALLFPSRKATSSPLGANAEPLVLVDRGIAPLAAGRPPLSRTRALARLLIHLQRIAATVIKTVIQPFLSDGVRGIAYYPSPRLGPPLAAVALSSQVSPPPLSGLPWLVLTSWRTSSSQLALRVNKARRNVVTSPVWVIQPAGCILQHLSQYNIESVEICGPKQTRPSLRT